MVLELWGSFLTQTFASLGRSLVEFFPRMFFAVAVFIAGWLVGVVLGRVVAQVIRALRIDNVLRGAGVEDILRRGGFSLDSGKFLGGLVEWFIIVVFLVASFDVLGLDQVNQFLQQVVLHYLPSVIAAVLVLLVSAVIAEAVQRVVVGASKAAEIRHSNFLGSVARWAIWVFAVLAALYQLGVAQALVQTLFTGIVVALSLALGLAFGLGGQEAAGKYLAHLSNEFSNKGKK